MSCFSPKPFVIDFSAKAVENGTLIILRNKSSTYAPAVADFSQMDGTAKPMPADSPIWAQHTVSSIPTKQNLWTVISSINSEAQRLYYSSHAGIYLDVIQVLKSLWWPLPVLFMTNIITRLAIVLLLCYGCWTQNVTPTGKFPILPYDTSQGAVTSYAFYFNSDTDIASSASVRVVFPSEFDPRTLALFTGCLYRGSSDSDYSSANCSVSYNTITVSAGSIVAGDLSVVISGVTNPTYANISSQFSIATLFQQIEVTTNSQFGQSPFSASPAASSTGTVANAFNTLIEQGSSWIFSFTPAQAYPANSSLRFLFPTGFSTNQVVCNVTGLFNQVVDTRVLPGGNVYDCLNVNMALPAGTAQKVVISGVVNPNFEMTASSFKVQVLQGNGVVALETISVTGSQLISHKNLRVTLSYPNLFRNNSCVYTFQVNVQSNMVYGDYMKMQWSGNWTFFLNGTYIVAGVNSNAAAGQTPNFAINYNSTSVLSTMYLSNFSSLRVGQPITFYVSLRTPLLAGSYNFLMETRRASGSLIEQYSQVIPINATTAYIKQLRMHPVHQSVKLPVGQTGPLEIVLGLNYYLPNTDVLTFGRIDIVISPQIPLPPTGLNGVPKCYFFGSTPAFNCTYDVSNSLQTTIIIFTPKDFVYESSEISVMVTTEGYVNPSYQGITIDTLVKRYLFKIMFYASYKSPTVPTEVLFTEWIPDPVPITSVACTGVTQDEYEYSHLVCTITTPPIDLCANGYVHLFTLEFLATNSAWDSSLGWNADTTYQDYPCLMFGTNLSAVPYVKCDLVTYRTGPYALQKTNPGAYINVYGFSMLPGSSSLTLEIPNLKHGSRWQNTNIRFSIQEETWGMRSPYVELYSQTLSNINSLDWNVGGYSFTTLTHSFGTAYPNKNTTFTLGPFSVSSANPNYFILEIDQSAFPDIGRKYRYACGTHLCSKFGLPHQYVIVYPQSNVGSSSITLTFPDIMTPAYSGTFVFKLRAFVSSNVVNKWTFNVVINPEVLAPATFQFDPAYEATTTLYPNREQFYKVIWALKNPLPASTSSITVTFSNDYSIVSSAYCLVTAPTVAAYDSRGIICVRTSSTMITISNLGAAGVGASFTLSTKLVSSNTSGTISPTVSIVTYYSGATSVDILSGHAHANNPITNTNLKTMTTFTVASPQILPQKIRRNYFGPIEFYFGLTLASTTSNAYSTVLTLTNDYYPPGNVLNLPLNCNIGGTRYACSYTLNPLTVTITHGTNVLNFGSNITLNITTDLLQPVNGFYHPVNAGRYLATLQLRYSNANTIEKGEFYYDYLPDDVPLFNATFAHRDTSNYNIFTFNLRTGSAVVPAFNDPSNAGRIYIGFPTSDSASTTVFDSNLGYSSTGMGTILPCWFNNGSSYVQPLASTSLQCRLRPSSGAPTPVWVEIINFQSVPANGNFQIIMGRILNPASITVDINFCVKINTINPSTMVESPLYEGMHNMFFDMRGPSISLSSELNSSTTMFQPGAKVGDLDKYLTITPYTPSTFNSGDWFILDLDPAFQLTLTVDNCLQGFYLTCIVFPTVNWLAVQIGNGTIIPVYPHISQLPLSISRVDTTYKCYNFISNRWSNTITYTISAAYRWQEIKGSITSFTFAVVGQQGKINTGRTNVEVLVGFRTTHLIPANGAIEIKFPTNSTLVPNIKTHCRSAVTMGSQLYGQNTGKPATNIQGEVGCYVQNTYSWIITGNDALPAGSQVYISGVIDMPTIATTSLGTGYVVTYIGEDSTNTFANSRIIDYTTATFMLNVNTSTWYPDESAVTFQTQPLRASFTGDLTFLVRTATAITANNGFVQLFLYTENQKGTAGGFAIATNPVCIIIRVTTGEKIGCLMAASTASYYVSYMMTPFETLSSGVDYTFRITTQNNFANEGIPFPTSRGVYKAESKISYSSGNPQVISNTFYIEVYGFPFSTLNFYSTVTLSGEQNLIMVEVAPTANIATNQQLVIEIPTVSIDGTAYFADDLGMGYTDYSDLVFDIYDSASGVSSMTCKVYPGQGSQSIPVKIVCSNFNILLTSSTVLKFGFWVTNPTVARSLAIPVTIYSYNQYTATKANWNFLESAFPIVTTNTPILDNGNFAFDTAVYQTYPVVLSLTTRNTAPLQNGDLYIVKVGFDPRALGLYSSGFTYNSGLGATGTLYVLQNCKTYVLKVGATSLNILASASATINAQIKNIYTPYWKPSNTESIITAYASYLSSRTSEKITHKDALPAMSPMEISTPSPSFSVTTLAGNFLAGQLEDYQFDFTCSSGGSLAHMQYTKMFSITFPSATVNDFGFAGTECTEGVNSAIEVQSCVIDISNRIIWITPVVKSTYTTGSKLSIQTRNLAIRNPSALRTLNVKSFDIRMYSWNTAVQPTLSASSLDHVFMRQQANIPTTLISYTTLSIPSHTEFDMSHRRFISRDFEPSNNFSGVNMKTPFRFKFKNVATFSDLSATGNFHSIALNYRSSYTYTSATTLGDMQMYVPACYLNEVRIQTCSISSTTITMSFKQALNTTQEISVMFTVLNPLNEQDAGFTYTAVGTTGTYYVGLTFTPHGSNGYYLEPEPIHPYYRTPSGLTTYPHFGITAATIFVGNNVVGVMNFLEFQFSFSRSDINGLVIEIPNIDQDGDVIYSNPTLLGLPSGSNLPCSVGFGLAVNCYYEAGSTTDYGIPTKIYVSHFAIQSGDTLQLRILLTNPDSVGCWPSIKVRALGGTVSAPNVMGTEFMGFWHFARIFKVLLNNGTYYKTWSDSTNSYPDKPLYHTNTLYRMYNNYYNIPSNGYVIMQWAVSTVTHGEIGEYAPNSAYGSDYFVVNFSPSNRVVYILIKYTSGFNCPSYHVFGSLRMRHFLHNSQTMYIFTGDGTGRQINYALPNTNQLTTYSDEYYPVTINRMDMDSRQTSVASWHFLSINIGNMSTGVNANILSTDPADMVLNIQFDSNTLFSSLNSACSIESGITSTDPLTTPYCQLQYYGSRYHFVIRKFNKFSSSTLNVWYNANNAAADVGTTTIILRLYASTLAYNNLGNSQDWPMARSWETYTYGYINYYYSSGAYTGNDVYPAGRSQLFGSLIQNGWCKITAISSSQITFQVYTGTHIEPSYNYYFRYRFYVERVTFGSGGCSSTSGSCSWQNDNQITVDSSSYTSWGAGVTRTITVNIAISGITSPYSALHAYMLFNVYTRYYYDGYCGVCGSYGCDCGCYWCSCGYCCSTCCNSCWRYWDWFAGLFMPQGYYFYEQIPFASSSWLTFHSNQYSVETEMSFGIGGFNINVGPNYGNYLQVQWNSGSWSDGNMFMYTYSNETVAQVDCKCIVAASISIGYNTGYTDTNCYRMLPNNQLSQTTVIVEANVPNGQAIHCYFPGFLTSSSANMDAFVRVVNSRTPANYPWLYYTYYYCDVNFGGMNGYGNNGGLSVSEPTIFSGSTIAGQTATNYYLQLTANTWFNQPFVYVSYPAPVPSQSFCTTSGYNLCRVYTSYINRRYFIVAQSSSSSINQITFNLGTTATLPNSREYHSGNLDVYAAWSHHYNQGVYYYRTSSTRDMSSLNAASPAYGSTPSLLTTNLPAQSSTILFSVAMSGYTFYGWNKRASWVGSRATWTISSMTITGCAVWFSDQMHLIDDAVFCTFSGSVVTITTRSDVTSSGTLYLAVQTSSVPTSYTATFYLYDKYRSGSDNSVTIYKSVGYGRGSYGSLTLLPASKVVFRKQAYRQLRTDMAPITYRFSNNFDYVYNETTSTSSHSLVISYPAASGISSYTYYCVLRQYTTGAFELFNEWYPKCNYYTTNQIQVWAIPGHILRSGTKYEISIFKIDNPNSIMTPPPSASYFYTSLVSYSGGTMIYLSRLSMRNYQAVNPITLSNVYTLTREAGVANSLCLDFAINTAGTSAQEIEFKFANLGLSSFQVSSGQEIPCFIGTGFSALATRTVKCVASTAGIGQDTPLYVRVNNMDTFTSGTTFRISFDGFTNPSMNTLLVTPMDVTITFIDMTTRKVYSTFFPELYVSDSVNINPTPVSLSSTYYMDSNIYGASTRHRLNFNWPQSSTNTISEKTLVALSGGILCCTAISGLSFDGQSRTFPVLWANTKANIVVLDTPSMSTGGTNFYINSLVNPYPYQVSTYNTTMTVSMIIYKDYQRVAVENQNQPAWTSYATTSNSMTLSSVSGIYHQTGSNQFHNSFLVTYDFTFSFAANDFATRKVTYCLVVFTAGVGQIDAAYSWITGLSPYYINTVGNVKFFNGGTYWTLNITGITDSVINTGQNWVVRLRFYPTGGTITYTSTAYCSNGILEFTNTASTAILSTNGYNNSNAPATSFYFAERRYLSTHYELQIKKIHPVTGASSNRLIFRFKAAYNISEAESFTIALPATTSTGPFIPKNTPTNLICVINPTYRTKTDFGVGYYTTCTYSSYTYTIKAPDKGMVAATEYTISIMEFNQLTSSFYMPTTPMRQELVFEYNSMVGLQYTDVYKLDYPLLFSSFSVLHSTLMASSASYTNVRNTIKLTFNPALTMAASTTSGSITESMLVLEVPTRYFSDDLNIPSVFTNQGLSYTNGQYYTHLATPSVTNANTRFMRGQNANNNAVSRFSVTDYGQFLGGTSYTFKFPLITHPQGDKTPVTYRLALYYIPNGATYPVTYGYYQLENINQLTTGGTRSKVNTDFIVSNNWVQNTMTLTFDFRSSYSMSNGFELMLKLNNNNKAAWTSIASLAAPVDANYGNSDYFPNINLLRIFKITTTTDYQISLGSYTTATDVQSFGFTFAYVQSSAIYYEGNFTSNSGTYTNSIVAVTSWTTLTLSRLSGLANYYVVNQYTVTWKSSSLAFPEGSYMLVSFSQMTVPSPLSDQCKSMNGFPAGILPTSVLLCKRYSSTQILITGYGSITANTQLSFVTWLKNPGLATETVSITVTSAAGKQIISGSASTITVSASYYGSSYLQLKEATTASLTPLATTSMTITFTLSTYSLGSGTSDYIYLNLGNWTLGTPTSEGKIVWRYKVNSWVYWVPVTVTQTGTWVKLPIYSNYTMPAGSLISIYLTGVLMSDFTGLKVSGTQFNYFTIQAWKNSALVEQQNIKVWVPPTGQSTFAVSPALTYVGATAMYTFTMTPNVNVNAGDFINVEFTTNDRLYNFFDAALGKSFTTPSFNIGCRELDGNTLISDSRLTCKLYKGNAASQIPAVIQIPVTKSITAGTLLTFMVLDIANPTANANQWVGFTGKVMRICDYGDPINLCSIYESVYYMSFVSGSTPGSFTGGSLTFNPTIVSATPAIHTFGNNYALQANDFIKIVYYPEVTVPASCTVAGHSCWTFPLENTLIIKIASSINSPYSLPVQGMTNLYKRYSSNTYTEIYRSGSMLARFYTSYSLATITTDPSSGTALGVSFTPTLTSNSYQLNINFNNIAKVDLTNLYQNSRVTSIWVVPPSGQIQLLTYCNATLQSLATETKPYPYRFICTFTGSGWSQKVVLTKPANFPAWDTSFLSRKITLYLEYNILGSLTANGMSNWVATAYAGTTQTTNDLISQGTGTFVIAPYLSPPISSVDFHTTSFNSRTCTINDQCMFYGYLLPSTLSSEYVIRKMVFTLPPEFKYAAITSMDSCLMKGYSDVPITSCLVDRTNSTLTITYVPSSYDHNYKLITLNTAATNKLFTSPAYPGTHYQMKADLYTQISSKDVLIETTRVNLTTVFGTYLSVPNIVAKIPLDGSTYGLFDIQFLVGSSSIPPGYPSSTANTITSQLVLIFANTFDFDLGTGYKAGDTVACAPVSGLTFNTMDRLTCRLFPSVSATTYPTIRITGYDLIANASTVRFRLAGLKTLPAGVTDYIKVGVELVYFNYGGVTGNLYEPTSVVVGPPTVAISPYLITFTVTENSTNTVGELANYTIAGTIANGFATVTTSDYIAVQFQNDVFERNFSINSKALCSLAASQLCYSFGKASIIYFNPSSSFSSTTLNFQLKNIIQAAYQFDYSNVTFSVFTVVSNKVNAKGSSVMTKFAKYSRNLSSIITSIDSAYGGDNEINYYFQFQLNHLLPTNGAVAINFPTVYPTLFYLSAQCIISGGLLSSSTLPYCTIASEYQINIYPNGVLLDPSSTYKLTLTNITNPNSDLSSHAFVAASYYDSNLYSKRIISQTNFDPPTINLIAVKNCTFQTTLTATNANITTRYSFVLICPSYIKQASQVKVYLPWRPAQVQTTCSSNTGSLYSYRCAIKQEFVGSQIYSYLSVLVRSINAQKLFEFEANLLNPSTGNYTILATVGYRGSVFLNGSTSVYVSALTFNASSVPIALSTYPQNAGEQAIYVFKLPSIAMANAPTVLSIAFPSVFSSFAGLTCGYNVSAANLNFTYVQLRLSQQTNSLNCSNTGSTVTFSNISAAFASANSNSSNYFYYIVYGVINPANSSSNNFTLTYQTSTTVYWTTNQPLPYYITSTPPYMQINKVNTSISTYLVQSNYTFQLTLPNIINLPASTPIALEINWPSVYGSVWDRMPTASSVKLTLGSTILTGTSSLAMNRLYSTINVTASTTFSSIQVDLSPWRNPNISLNCTASPIFHLSLYNYKFNNIIASTVLNNKDCVLFTNRLYTVRIEGNSVINSGTLANYTVILEKPAENLTIVPTTTSSAISFEPASIVFSNYSTNVTTFVVKAATSLTGNYTIHFTKTEGLTGTFYNDISDLNISVVAPTVPYYISFSSIDTKSVGLPITLPIKLTPMSSNSFTLFYSHNCSTDYSLSPASSLLIASKTENTNITITYKGSVVPAVCAITFSLSYSNYNYQLANKTLYFIGFRSTDKSSIIPPMRLVVSPYAQTSADVGKTVLTKNSTLWERLKPQIYSLKVTDRKSNSANFSSVLTEMGTLYYVVIPAGAPETLVQGDIRNATAPQQVTSGSANVQKSMNIVADFQATELSSQSQYKIAAYLSSSVGDSEITYVRFNTTQASNGAELVIALSSIQTNSTVLAAVSKILRVPLSRMAVLTYSSTLLNYSTTYNSNNMNQRSYVYTIVIAPNPTNETLSPIDIANSLRYDQDIQNALLAVLPSFRTDYPVYTLEVLAAKPRISKPAEIPILTYQSVTVRMSFWSPAYVYAVILPTPSADLLSNQIVSGLDDKNNKVVASQYISTQTNMNGSVEFTFNKLNGNTSYTIHISAECVLPYTPRIAMTDSEVVHLPINTFPNLNLHKTSTQMVDVLKAAEENKAVDKGWSDAVEKHIKENSLRSGIQNKSKSSVRVIRK